MTQNGKHNCRFGVFLHRDIIGKEYGSQIISQRKTGFLYVLAPTPFLWSSALSHRTQIVYAPDAAFIRSKLQIAPGSVVIEAGSGSGALSHEFALAVRPSGHLHTFEFHQQRCETLLEEFSRHELLDTVTLTCRDVCRDGFTLNLEAHAAFLDLPSPWLAIPHLPCSFARDRVCRLICFSPCIEQVQRTVKSLRTEGWTDICMFEVSPRRYEARYEEGAGNKDITTAVRRLSALRQRRKALGKVNDEVADTEVDMTDADSTSAAIPGRAKAVHRDVLKGEVKDVKTHTSFLTFALLPPRNTQLNS